MEFLMTYGWAILVVIAAIGALAYFGILNPVNFMSEVCAGTPGVDCLEKATVTASDDVIKFAIKNNIGTAINITAATADGDCGATPSAFTVTPDGGSVRDVKAGHPATLQPDQQAIAALTCANDLKAGKISTQITLTYKTLTTKLDHPSVITVKARAS